MTDIINFTKGIFTSLAEYGTNLIPGANLALLRGSGNYNPGPNYDQTTYRGPAYNQAYYVSKLQDIENDENGGGVGGVDDMYYEYQGLNNTTAYSEYDTANKNDSKKFVIGSSYFHPEDIDSWNKTDYKGSRGTDRYQIYAINSLKMVPNPLLNYFFSEENVNHLQNTMISEVKRIRNTTINRQSTDELLNIMKNKYEYALSGFLPLSKNTKYSAAPMGTPKGEPIYDSSGKIVGRSAYWNLGADSESGMSLEFQLSQLNQAVLEETNIEWYRCIYTIL